MKKEKRYKIGGLGLLVLLSVLVVIQGSALYRMYRQRDAAPKMASPAPIPPDDAPALAPALEARHIPDTLFPFRPPTPQMPSSLFDDPFFTQPMERSDLQRDLDRLFSDIGNLESFADLKAQSSMAVRVEQDENNYIVTLDTGGADILDHLKVGVMGKQLTVSGTRRKTRKEPGTGGSVLKHQSERDFLQSFPLPGRVKEDEVESEFKDGVLTITLPKETASLPRFGLRRNMV